MQKPFMILNKIAKLIDSQKKQKNEIESLAIEFQNSGKFEKYKLSTADIITIAVIWDERVNNKIYRIDSLEILKKIYDSQDEQIIHLSEIVSLLKREILFTSTKKIILRKYGFRDENAEVSYSKLDLLENDIDFHRTFMEIVLGEKEEKSESNNQPFSNNREFLDDWFVYLEKQYEFSNNTLTRRQKNIELEDYMAQEYLSVLEWKTRIENRTPSNKENFPLFDLVDEYNLDENETKIVMYLVKEELENTTCDTDDIIQLISMDHHEMYKNKRYISDESNLVKNGIVEISDGVFFRNALGSIKIAPDIMRRIIMKTPVDDDERLMQLLQGNDIFTLINPTQTFDHLILPDKMKRTIGFSLNQYSSNVDKTLSDWGFCDEGLQVVGKIKKKVEPGMLMLFYGAPGTGKTFAAGAIAQALNKKLLITDISRIQSKWVGDSEKNVRKMFSLFEKIVRRVKNPPVLLLNEADQFLTKRSNQANSSVDKMMNSMQNLFLEAFENLRGVLIATTNLHENLDDAFSRRFNLKLNFPMPQSSEREKLWNIYLPKTIPGVENINVEFLANRYNLSGGQIKLVIKNACIEAASREGIFQKLLQSDLYKYCEIEDSSSFDRSKIVGFL